MTWQHVPSPEERLASALEKLLNRLTNWPPPDANCETCGFSHMEHKTEVHCHIDPPIHLDSGDDGSCGWAYPMPSYPCSRWREKIEESSQ